MRKQMSTNDLHRSVRTWSGCGFSFAACIAAITMISAPAAALDEVEEDDFNLDWNTIDCGGGDAGGAAEQEDSWLLEGTIGQADAGMMEGDGDGAMSGVGEDGETFSLQGGFWTGPDDGAAIACPSDLDGNGSVAINDLLLLLVAWGTEPGGPPDFDGDGVGMTDLLTLLGDWGDCPGT
jgi:hypothetical protein